MKGFIDVIAQQNGAKILISISSISLVEEFPNSRTRIVLKEKLELNGNNLEVISTDYYLVIREKIKQAQL